MGLYFIYVVNIMRGKNTKVLPLKNNLYSTKKSPPYRPRLTLIFVVWKSLNLIQVLIR